MHAISLLILVAATDLPGSSALEVPGSLARLLEDGRWDSTPASFRVIALSHLADGCAGQAAALPERRDAAHRCVRAALDHAKALGPSDDALFRSHLLLVFGAADATGGCGDTAAHEALARGLAEESLADPLGHAASYAHLPHRWPADQAVTLAGLRRFDLAHPAVAALVDEPLHRWKATLAEHLDAKTKLPRSELTGQGPGARWPRGCAQSWMTRYLAELDPELASTWWRQYQKHFLVRLPGVVGFREWPPGVVGPADVDSGPIVLGIGAAASAFAIAAAKSQGDALLATQLEASAAFATSVGLGGTAAQSLLAQAIRFQERWQPGPR